MNNNRVPENLIEILDIASQNYPEQIAMYFLDRRISYSELYFTVNRFAQGLSNLGVRREDRVGLLLANSPEFVISNFGIVKTGATVVPINNMFKEEEVEFIIRDAKVTVIVTSLAYLDIIKSIKERVASLKHIILVDGIVSGTLNFYEIIERTISAFRPIKLSADSIASILYTSGTTGQPKGAMLTHSNFLSNCMACVKSINAKDNDNFMCFLPMFHSFAWTVCVLMPIAAGASITIIDSLRPFRKVIRNVVRKKVTVFVGIPSIFQILTHIHIPAIFTSRILKMIAPLRLCISGAAALSPEILERFEARFNIPLLEGYGLTETSPVVSLNPMRGRRKAGSVGLPLEEIEVKVVDEQDNDLLPGQIGELLVRGPNVMRGYLNNIQATQSTIKEDWLYTGDLGCLDEEGYIYIVDRKKDMINVRGLNVYPAEIERVLLNHSKIKEAAVVGVLDNYKGEVPKAFVVLQEGGKLTNAEITGYLRKKIASYKIPKFIEFCQSLPKTATGKVAKNKLVQSR